MEGRGRLIAIDGVCGRAVAAEAIRALKTAGRTRGGISRWDASGLFEQLTAADEEAGAPSARTLLLLYAADLAFRLRWEIEPALAEGKTVVAAQYIDTAIAFGRAAGLSGRWLANLFQFARTPQVQCGVSARPASRAKPNGFVEFASVRLSGRMLGLTKQQLIARTRQHLSFAADRSKRRAASRYVETDR